ncbi:hypothetical protein ACFCXK_14590 [Streptomyces sp. NPDC056269]|uniref:hypothetical protein n=1 Tax=Streptomyces sp. NPDC056269 TaxID=3345768 RepID=UPI0035E01FD8
MRNRDVQPPPHRTCPDCKRSLPVTSDHFHKDSLRVDGFTRRCADCRNTAARNTYAQDPEKFAQRVRERRQERTAHFESIGRYEAA